MSRTGHPDRITCKQCQRIVRDTFKGKWRHMVRYHPEALAKRILPLIFLPADQLRDMGVQLAHSWIKSLKSGE